MKLAAEAVAAGPGEVVPLATQVAILWEAGRGEEACGAFERLREIAARADLDLPLFERLAPVAASAKVEGDWRRVPEAPGDLGHRPALDSLGPLRWEPPQAPGWRLLDADGATISLDDYRGRAVLVVFFLGRGCTHCMEQLNAFAPKYAAFKEAGIDIVAVSTDSPEGLKFTYQIAADDAKNPFPFPLVSDEGLDVFKEYRAYDDFEKLALHGTFLVDGAGRIRWQDIGFEPFMQQDFLLDECVRLLSVGCRRSTADGAMDEGGGMDGRGSSFAGR